MTTNTTKQLKRTAAALTSIIEGKRFVIPGRKWIDPIKLNGGRFLTVDGRVTTLRHCNALERHLHQRTTEDVQLLCAALRDERLPHRLWVWTWDLNRAVHTVEPMGADMEAADKILAQRFPNA